MARAAAAQDYEAALAGICELFEAARQGGIVTQNEQLLGAYWEIGGRVGALGGPGARARYGERVLARLSADLGRRFGRGFSERNLTLMRKLHEEWEKPSLDPRLCWTQYRDLMRVADRPTREGLWRQAAQDRLSTPELRRLVEAALPTDVTDGEEPRLARPAGELHLVTARRPAAAAEATELWLDLGFGVRQRPATRLPRGRVEGDVLMQVAARAGFSLVPRPDLDGPSWLYVAWLDRVVDGDTLVAQVELAGGLHIKQRLRLRGVDAPELGTPEGEAAKAALTLRLRGCNPLVLRTHRLDRYHRYVADVLCLKRVADPARILERGHHLNQELLDAGHGPPNSALRSAECRKPIMTPK